MLKIMAMYVLRKIAGDLQATEFFAIMMDECTDATNQEQVSYKYYLLNKLCRCEIFHDFLIAGGFSSAVGRR